jgi:hypothetical protein
MRPWLQRVSLKFSRQGENMLTLQELSDRAEIQNLLVAEASSMDRRDWQRWQSVFTPDAFIDYSENDGATGGR